MLRRITVAVVLVAGLLHAQDNQSGPPAGWPCVPGRAADPAYLDVAESTGGQLVLFQKNEAAQTPLVMNAGHSHPATILRAVGHLNGDRTFEFPVDSGVESLLLLTSLECRNVIAVSRPGGQEMTAANSALNVDLQAGRLLRIERPETGQWRIRLSGSGLFVLSVLAKADLSLTGVTFATEEGPARVPRLHVKQEIQLRLSGPAAELKVQLADATGEALSAWETARISADGLATAMFAPQSNRFRIVVTGMDSAGIPFRRMYPVLFRAVAAP